MSGSNTKTIEQVHHVGSLRWDPDLEKWVPITADDLAGVGSSAAAINDGEDGAIKATVTDLANSNPLNVAIVNGAGDQITSFGGGTQYTEGDTDASITGTASLMEIAADTLAPIPGTVADGQLVNLGTNNDITGTVTANAGTNLNTSALALEASIQSVLTELGQKTEPANQQHAIIDSGTISLPSNAAQETGGNLDAILTELQAKTEPANTQVTVGPPDSVSASFLIDALNETGEVAVSGYCGVSVTITYVAFNGTVNFNISGDAGVTYGATYVITSAGQLVASVVGGGSTTVGTYTFPMAGGNSHVQVKATAFSSGSVTCVFRSTASFVQGLPATGLTTGSVIPTSMQVGGYWADVANLITPIRLRSGTQLSSDTGLVTKPVNVVTAPLFTRSAAATATITNLDFSTRDEFTGVITVLASTATRLGAYVKNETDSTLYIKEGSAASPISYTDILYSGDTYVMDQPPYTGIITMYVDHMPEGYVRVTQKT